MMIQRQLGIRDAIKAMLLGTVYMMTGNYHSSIFVRNL